MKRLATFLKYAFFAIVCLPIIEKECGAQIEVRPGIRIGILAPAARDYLAKEWDKHLNDDPYLERGYCGYFTLAPFGGEIAFLVTRITPPDTVVGTPETVRMDFRCFSQYAIPIHVHPPRSCERLGEKCAKDGLYAYQCMPSDNDRQFLTFYGYPFGMVQCERKGVRTYWPVGVAGV